jgi:hypothetical protein
LPLIATLRPKLSLVCGDGLFSVNDSVFVNSGGGGADSELIDFIMPVWRICPLIV